MKFVLSRQRTGGTIGIERRECTRVIKYKGMFFAACPNRIDGFRPYSYDILEVSTGLRVTQVPRVKDGYPYIRDNFYLITKEMKTSYIIGMVKEMHEYVAKNGELDLIIDMESVFNSLREMGILDMLVL